MSPPRIPRRLHTGSRGLTAGVARRVPLAAPSCCTHVRFAPCPQPRIDIRQRARLAEVIALAQGTARIAYRLQNSGGSFDIGLSDVQVINLYPRSLGGFGVRDQLADWRGGHLTAPLGDVWHATKLQHPHQFTPNGRLPLQKSIHTR